MYSDYRTTLQHARDYCDEQAGIALHDPEGTRDEQLSNDYQHAAAILDALQSEVL